MSDRNKALKFTRVEGGLKKPCTFEIYEDELSKFSPVNVEKREVYSHGINAKITSRVVKIENVYVHALFFEDGKEFDVSQYGFKLRPNTDYFKAGLDPYDQKTKPLAV